MAYRAACVSRRLTAFSRLPLGLAIPAASSSRISYPHGPPRAFKLGVVGINHEAKLEVATPLKENDTSSEHWKIKMLYDGECPLCMREVNMLKERNKHYDAIKFVDISSNSYSPADNQGLDYKTVMGRIHAILSDGTVVTDVDAFRKLYEEVGLGWVYAITKYEPIATIASKIYGFWAKYRLQMTGRPSLEDILDSRKKNTVESCRDDKVCKM